MTFYNRNIFISVFLLSAIFLQSAHALNGDTLLYEGAESNNIPMIEKALEAGNDINARDRLGRSALMYAAKNGHLTAAELLISKGADINLCATGKANHGESALIMAIDKGHADICDLLLKKNPIINDPKIVPMPPLFLAVAKDNVDIVNLLLKNGADINLLVNNKKLPNCNALFLSIALNKPHIAETLIKNKANLELKILPSKATCLIIASHEGKFEFCKLLIENGAEINAYDLNGLTPLMAASMKGHYDIAKLLLDNKAKVESKMNKSASGATALGGAVGSGHINIVKLLIDHGADVNSPVYLKDNNRSTPLIGAVLKGNYDMAKLLIDNGANIKETTNDGKTAYDWAVAYGHNNIAGLLKPDK